jgi:DNA repair exonuclease SbcCD ATPase subunit
LRLIIIILIAVLSTGSVVISLGFLTTPEYLDVPEISSQYEKLDTYKNELEKINQQNQKILNELEKINQQNQKVLNDLENEIKNSDDVHIDQINDEIELIKRVIEENKAELEQVITKLSQMESEP